MLCQTPLDGPFDVEGRRVEYRERRSVVLADQQFDLGATEDKPFIPVIDQIVDDPEIVSQTARGAVHPAREVERVAVFSYTLGRLPVRPRIRVDSRVARSSPTGQSKSSPWSRSATAC